MGDLVKKVKELNMPAVAVTDWNNLYGALHFLKAAKEYGEGLVKPIYGIEFGVEVEGTGPALRHMVLLAKDNEGFRNLLQLATKAHIQYGFNEEGMRPHLPLNEILAHRAGLIAMTGGLKGVLNSFITQDQETHAIETLEKLKAFGPDNLYLELQDTGLTAQTRANEMLIDLAKKHKLKTVATSDVHYMNREDALAQEIWMMVERKITLEENPRSPLISQEFYLKDAEEMRESFSHVSEACDATLEIAERCNVKLNFKDKEGKRIYYLPDFAQGGKDAELNQFAEECRAGLRKRLESQKVTDAKLTKEYEDRLEYEIGTIQKMGFSGYYLIVSDFIRWAKNHGIPVGPGRGSGAGSLCAYVLDITDLDPIEYGLLFERFLNPERISMPDFDIDFCQERRGEVIQYVAEKYGRDRVCQIITFGGEKSKAAIKDVGRVLGLTFAESNRLTKLIPVIQGRPHTIPEAMEEVEELRKLVEADVKFKQVIELGTKIEGALRQPGVHAAGVIIAGQPLEQLAPMSRDVNGNFITQWDMKSSEEAGLVKFDFLGLVTLDLMDLACKFINARAPEMPDMKGTGPAYDKLDYSNIPVDDPRSYEIMAKGDTLGVFQLESSGMQNLCKRIKPDRFGDISAINALFRPGPLESGMVDDYVNRKHGKAKVEVMFPEMELCLRETYGVIIYQEQVQEIAKVVAGYTLGGADLLRRAMGKKDPKEMAKQRATFVDGAVKAGKPAKMAGELFDLIEKFAGYGFNKSHAAAYAKLAVQTAYLKSAYPTEFFAALLTIWRDDTETLARYIQDARLRGIQVLPPDVNESGLNFTVVSEGVIRFGLTAVKNVGEGAVEAILEGRKTGGPFKDLFDFLGRIDGKKINRRTVECLIQVGAFDDVEGKEKDHAELRGRYIVTLEKALEWATKSAEQKEQGQFSLFGSPSSGKGETGFAPPPYVTGNDVPGRNPTTREMLEWERTLIGVYISGSPLDKFKDRAEQAGCVPIFSLTETHGEGASVTLAVIVSEFREHKIKRGRSAGRSMGIMKLEDSTGTIEMLSFPDHFAAYEKFLRTREPLIIRAELEFEEDRAKLTCGQIVVNGRVAVEELSGVEEKWPSKVRLEVFLDRLEGAMSAELLYTEMAGLLKKYPGTVPVSMKVRKNGFFETGVEFGQRFAVQPQKVLLEELARIVSIPGCVKVEAVY